MNLSLVTMPYILKTIFNRFALYRALLAALPCLTLAGCTLTTLQPGPDQPLDEKLSQHQLADYFAVRCDEIWALTGAAADSNPLYWLRVMDCADRLLPVQARAGAREYSGERWQDSFKRGILLANARIAPPERRSLIMNLESLSWSVPAQVRPLYQIWHDDQTLRLRLADERARYSKLQQTTDSELDALRQQQQQLRSQLDSTTRKLESLTDIERQLSSRKTAGSYDADTSRVNESAVTPHEKSVTDQPAHEEKP